jgi:sugar/nucleoside kinase (ribokinase family)
VGAASRDIDEADPRGWRLGGTVSYAALAAARLGVRVRALIGADADAATASELDALREAGVDIELAPLAIGPVFENRQLPDGGREQVVFSASDTIAPAALPADWRGATNVLLGPVANEIPDDWVDAVPRSSFVALAWQGLLRQLLPGQPVSIQPLTASPLVRRADVLFVSAEDVAAGGPPLDNLLRPGQDAFITHGGHGALHVREDRLARTLAFVAPRPRRVPIDTTGAGDVFLAAYVAARISAASLIGTRDEWRLAALAAAAASLNVTARDLTGVPGIPQLCEALLKRPA